MYSPTYLQQSRSQFGAAGIAVLIVALLILMCWISGGAALLMYGYPAAALLIAGLLYVQRLPFYWGFAWLIWFFTPFVRRIVDYQIGAFTPVSPVMLTPFLVSGLAVSSVLELGSRWREKTFRPFALAGAGILYGYLIGILRNGFYSATFNLLEWIVPVFFCMHVLMHWRAYPGYRDVVRRTFAWGVLITGVYGIVQFISPQPWDVFWMVGSEMNSIGKTDAFQVRVFSTLNSPGPFAMTLVPGLLLLFGGRGVVYRLAMIPGYVAFLLSLVRAAWGGWFLALAFATWRMRQGTRGRLAAFLLVGIILSIPFLRYAPIEDQIGDRAETITSLSDDGSLNARLGLYQRASGRILTNPIGEGLGTIGKSAKLNVGYVVNFDSGLLALPVLLGWPGALCYLGGLYLLVIQAVRVREETTDEFAVIAAGIMVAFLVILFFANSLIGIKGMILWSFMGLARAAQVYYAQPRTARPVAAT